eukprot:gene19396-biopygen23485
MCAGTLSGEGVYRGDTSKSLEWLHRKFSSSPAERSWLTSLEGLVLRRTSLVQSLKGPSLKGSGKCDHFGSAGSCWEHAGVAAIHGILVRRPGRPTSPPMCGQNKCGQVCGQNKSGQIKSHERAKIAVKLRAVNWRAVKLRAVSGRK